MEKLTSSFQLFTLILLSLLLSSCSSENIVQSPIGPSSGNSTLGKTIRLKKKWPLNFIIDTCFGFGKITIDTSLNKTKVSDIGPFLREGDNCGQQTIYGWAVDHYEPMPGKVLGIMNLYQTQDEFSKLKNKYGYSGLFINDKVTYDLAVNTLHFDPQNLMVNIKCDPVGCTEWMSRIDNMPAGSYYIDESVEHGCSGNDKRMYSPDDFISIKTYINQKHPGSLLVTSGYKRCMHLIMIGSFSDIMMYPAYRNWFYWGGIETCLNTNMSWGPTTEGVFLEGGNDQRDSWTDMRNIFGSKFSRVWINTVEGGEFEDLFGHARNLGLNQVWVYNFLDGDGNSSYRSNQFGYISSAAYHNGFLREFFQQVRIVYRCDKYVNPNLPCPCDPTSEEDWTLYSITPTGIIKENTL